MARKKPARRCFFLAIQIPRDRIAGIMQQSLVVLKHIVKITKIRFLCCRCDAGAAGVGEAEDFGGFVEGFADGVVEGGADDFEGVVALHVDELSVAAGDYEG